MARKPKNKVEKVRNIEGKRKEGQELVFQNFSSDSVNNFLMKPFIIHNLHPSIRPRLGKMDFSSNIDSR